MSVENASHWIGEETERDRRRTLIAELRAEIQRIRAEIKRLQEPIVPMIRDEDGFPVQTCIDCGARARRGRVSRTKPRCWDCERVVAKETNKRSQARKRQRLREPEVAS